MIMPSLIVKSCTSVNSSEADKIEIERVEVKKREGPEIHLKMYNADEKKLEDMTLEKYVEGVLAAEMPASFEMEALKAQAVAARTLAFRNLEEYGGPGCSKYKGADVCSRHDHCQAWISEAEMKKNWGSSYETNIKKIRDAVAATWGEVITYEGEPIEVLFHSTSGGKTENVEDVFSKALPYLRSVTSEGEEDAPRYQARVTMSKSKFISIFKKKYSRAKLSEKNLEQSVRILKHSEGGGVMLIEVGGVTIKGTDFRKMYNLNSHKFTISFKGDQVIIETIGYGHRVGMSQLGANSMAKEGSSYKEILAHYYLDTEISYISDLIPRK